MPNIFDFFESHECRILEELAEQLEGSLKAIAHGGMSEDRKYLRETQRHFRRVTKRGRLFRETEIHLPGNLKVPEGTLIIQAAVYGAYSVLNDLGRYKNPIFNTPENIAEDAENAIWDFLYIEPKEIYYLKDYEEMIFDF